MPKVTNAEIETYRATNSQQLQLSTGSSHLVAVGKYQKCTDCIDARVCKAFLPCQVTDTHTGEVTHTHLKRTNYSSRVVQPMVRLANYTSKCSLHIT